MNHFMELLLAEESGQGMVEYALIIALIAVLLIATLVGLKDKIKNLFEGIKFDGTT